MRKNYMVSLSHRKGESIDEKKKKKDLRIEKKRY